MITFSKINNVFFYNFNIFFNIFITNIILFIYLQIYNFIKKTLIFIKFSNFMKALIYFILGVLIISYGIGMYHEILDFHFKKTKQFYFWVSMLVSMFFCYRFINQGSYWATFKHELTHNFFAVVTFKKPMGFSVNTDGSGHFRYLGKSNVFIDLSPYFFPMVTVLFLFFAIFEIRDLKVYYIFLGVASGFDSITAYKDIHPRQTDFNTYGYRLSIVIIVLFTIILYGALFAYIQGGVDDSWTFLKKGILRIIDFTKYLIHKI